jgi:hypothetical protein
LVLLAAQQQLLLQELLLLQYAKSFRSHGSSSTCMLQTHALRSRIATGRAWRA